MNKNTEYMIYKIYRKLLEQIGSGEDKRMKIHKYSL